mmetsp:Transcript_16766/g.46845  ORF Transcript_16766/g.46845 Transcript_16766/m.46845 type:complete len:230 (-) Transcript_16766:2451-3140(-)
MSSVAACITAGALPETAAACSSCRGRMDVRIGFSCTCARSLGSSARRSPTALHRLAPGGRLTRSASCPAPTRASIRLRMLTRGDVVLACAGPWRGGCCVVLPACGPTMQTWRESSTLGFSPPLEPCFRAERRTRLQTAPSGSEAGSVAAAAVTAATGLPTTGLLISMSPPPFRGCRDRAEGSWLRGDAAPPPLLPPLAPASSGALAGGAALLLKGLAGRLCPIFLFGRP